jgi:hypothetical protein
MTLILGVHINFTLLMGLLKHLSAPEDGVASEVFQIYILRILVPGLTIILIYHPHYSCR